MKIPGENIMSSNANPTPEQVNEWTEAQCDEFLSELDAIWYRDGWKAGEGRRYWFQASGETYYGQPYPWKTRAKRSAVLAYLEAKAEDEPAPEPEPTLDDTVDVAVDFRKRGPTLIHNLNPNGTLHEFPHITVNHGWYYTSSNGSIELKRSSVLFNPNLSIYTFADFFSAHNLYGIYGAAHGAYGTEGRRRDNIARTIQQQTLNLAKLPEYHRQAMTHTPAEIERHTRRNVLLVAAGKISADRRPPLWTQPNAIYVNGASRAVNETNAALIEVESHLTPERRREALAAGRWAELLCWVARVRDEELLGDMLLKPDAARMRGKILRINDTGLPPAQPKLRHIPGVPVASDTLAVYRDRSDYEVAQTLNGGLDNNRGGSETYYYAAPNDTGYGLPSVIALVE